MKYKITKKQKVLQSKIKEVAKLLFETNDKIISISISAVMKKVKSKYASPPFGNKVQGIYLTKKDFSQNKKKEAKNGN